VIIRKSPAELELMARAGAVVAEVHEVVRDALAPGRSTAQLDAIAEAEVRHRGAVPSFKGYRGFPATLCTSVNDQVVHGIPSRDVVLAEGDLVKVDLGAVVEGYHADSAATWIVGEPGDARTRELVDVTRAALWEGLLAAVEGGRLGDISAAIERRGAAHRLGVVREYVGHGIGRALHEEPSVPNHGRPGRGLRLASGLVLAVEPMFNAGAAETDVLADGWTVVTADGSLSAHWEHTVAITPDGPWVLTARSDEPAHPLAELDRVPVAPSPGARARRRSTERPARVAVDEREVG
jgi:methionyl aminopeptidase